MNRNILAIDIGSSKICSVVAEVRDSEVHIIGHGYSKSRGIKRGVITNIDLASRAIRESVESAQRVTGIPLPRAIVSLSGAQVQSFNVNGIVNVVSENVTLDTISMVLDNAVHGANIPRDYEVVHVLPCRFKLDNGQGQDDVDPIGMSGRSLQVEAHIVTVQKASLDNLKKAVSLANVEIENIVLSSYAASIATLNEDEKHLGVACIDIGANTSELMIYHDDSMRYDAFLAVGSNHITNDIARVLNTPIEIAESIKKQHANLMHVDEGFVIEIPRIGNTSETTEVGLEFVYKVVYSRVSETLAILKRCIETSGLSDKISGVVLTGGMANLNGIREFAASLFHPLPVRLAQPVNLPGLFDRLKDPSNAVAVGLVLYGAGHFINYEKDSRNEIRSQYDERKNMVESNYYTPNNNDDIGEIDLGDLTSNDGMENVANPKGNNKSFRDKFIDLGRKLFG